MHVRFESNPEKLGTSICLPLFSQQRTFAHCGRHVRLVPIADTAMPEMKEAAN